jgi:hypothetical protein
MSELDVIRSPRQRPARSWPRATRQLARADEDASRPVDIPESVNLPAPAAQRPGACQLPERLRQQRAQPGQLDELVLVAASWPARRTRQWPAMVDNAGPGAVWLWRFASYSTFWLTQGAGSRHRGSPARPGTPPCRFGPSPQVSRRSARRSDERPVRLAIAEANRCSYCPSVHRRPRPPPGQPHRPPAGHPPPTPTPPAAHLGRRVPSARGNPEGMTIHAAHLPHRPARHLLTCRLAPRRPCRPHRRRRGRSHGRPAVGAHSCW